MNKNFNISSNGSWEGQVESKHQYDSILSKAILNILQKNNVKNLLDLGCGIGKYSKYFTDNDIFCECFDSHPDTKQLTNGLCETLDLSTAKNFNKTYDCVLSLEVGEHIPHTLENNFIQNITNHSHKLIIMSWAIPGQPGDGHINCQNNEYIINLVTNYNFLFDNETTNNLRQNSSLWWFKNTIMVFKK